MAQSNQDRLANLKCLREAELASTKPSHNYIEDLEFSIAVLETRLNRDIYEVMS